MNIENIRRTSLKLDVSITVVDALVSLPAPDLIFLSFLSAAPSPGLAFIALDPTLMVASFSNFSALAAACESCCAAGATAVVCSSLERRSIFRGQYNHASRSATVQEYRLPASVAPSCIANAVTARFDEDHHDFLVGTVGSGLILVRLDESRVHILRSFTGRSAPQNLAQPTVKVCRLRGKRGVLCWQQAWAPKEHWLGSSSIPTTTAPTTRGTSLADSNALSSCIGSDFVCHAVGSSEDPLLISCVGDIATICWYDNNLHTTSTCALELGLTTAPTAFHAAVASFGHGASSNFTLACVAVPGSDGTGALLTLAEIRAPPQ